MVKIEWIITDNLTHISSEDFDNENNGIVSGYFELNINQSKEGFCPQREIAGDEEGMEDVLYWLLHLREAVYMIKKRKRYEMLLLTMNRYKIVMELDDFLKVCFVNKVDSTIKWEEKVELQEFENEINKNIEKFLQLIKEMNPELMKSRWIKKFYELVV